MFLKGKYCVILAGVAIAILVYLAGTFLIPAKQSTVFFVSSFGFLALLTLILVISSPLLVRLKNNSLTRFLLVQQRWIGLFAFFFAATHVSLVYNFFFGWDFLKPLSLPNSTFLILGAVAFLFLALMAATSNDFAIRTLGRNWKRLQYVIYAALALVFVHAYNVGLFYFPNRLVPWILAALVVIVLALKWNIVKIPGSREKE